MTFLSQVQSGETILVRPRRSIGGLFPDVVVEESHEDSLQITEHPVEQGAAINDHAFLKPRTVTIRAGVSDAVSSGGTPSVDFYDKLRELQQKREPFDIVTGKRKYTNMLLEILSVTTDATTENVLSFSADCREVIIVKTQTASVPPRARHKNPGKTGGVDDKGQKQAEPHTSGLGSATDSAKTKAEREAEGNKKQ